MKYVHAEHIRSAYAKGVEGGDEFFATCPYCLKLNKLPDPNVGLRVCGDCGKIFEVK